VANATGTLLEQARLCGLDRQIPTEPHTVDLTGSGHSLGGAGIDGDVDTEPSIDLRAAARVLPSADARLRAARANAAARVNAATRRRSHIAGAAS
jgi:hypothetical protein